MVTCAGTGCSTPTKTFFHTDKLGSVIAMSDMSGNLVEGPYIYDPYGRCTIVGGAGCTTQAQTTVPFRFTGQRLEWDNGLYYYRARFYFPAIGRFLQTDPVGPRDDLNLYMYVHNDPTDLTDPSGDQTATMTMVCLPNGCVLILTPPPPASAGTPARHQPGLGDVIVHIWKNSQSDDEPPPPPPPANGEKPPPPFVPPEAVSNSGNPVGALPKPPTGKGTAAPADRDPKRLFPKREREAKRQEQGDQCANGCGTTLTEDNSAGHHIDRHADGGRTESDNHAEVCMHCHRELHGIQE